MDYTGIDTIDDLEFERRTLAAIRNELGLGGLARFLATHRSGSGDYTPPPMARRHHPRRPRTRVDATDRSERLVAKHSRKCRIIQFGKIIRIHIKQVRAAVRRTSGIKLLDLDQGRQSSRLHDHPHEDPKEKLEMASSLQQPKALP